MLLSLTASRASGVFLSSFNTFFLFFVSQVVIFLQLLTAMGAKDPPQLENPSIWSLQNVFFFFFFLSPATLLSWLFLPQVVLILPQQLSTDFHEVRYLQGLFRPFYKLCLSPWILVLPCHHRKSIKYIFASFCIHCSFPILFSIFSSNPSYVHVLFIDHVTHQSSLSDLVIQVSLCL